MRLIIAMDFGVQAGKAHEQGRAGTGMTEDEKLVTRKKVPRFGDFLRRDGWDGVAAVLFGSPRKRILAAGLKRLKNDMGLLSA